MFGKRPSELTADDIKRVCDEGWQEGSELELKGTLPAKKGLDPWVEGENRIGNRARDELIEEVVAFANSYGGWLLLGMEETASKPPRAASVKPIPRCTELAERFRLMCRDCIDPGLPILEIEGVPMQPDGAGVVVFHVPRSRMAPHRHVQTRECYRRHADRTEKMDMREIQDLTLQVERGMAAVDRRFRERRAYFSRQFGSAFDGAPAFGLRATLVPLTPIYVERVHGNNAVQPPSHKFLGMIDGRGPCELSIPIPDGHSWRPIVRGSILRTGNHHASHHREVFCGGTIEYKLIARKVEQNDDEPRLGPPTFLKPDWLMGLFGNAVCSAEKFRMAAAMPDIAYGLEIEIIVRGRDLPIGKYGHDPFDDYIGSLPSGQTHFPGQRDRYSIGTRSEFQELSKLFQRDFWHAAGLDPTSLLEIDFDRALQELGLV